MPGEGSSVDVTVRYWAGARAVAGVDCDVVPGCATVGDAIVAVTALHPELARVADVSTLLLDGRSVTRDEPVPQGALLEVLPPFAGG
jgi:sulfur-carrier protein